MKTEHFAETNQVHDKPIAGISSSVETTVRPNGASFKSGSHWYDYVHCHNARCGKLFAARRTDIRRGWGKFCSLTCGMQHRAKPRLVSNTERHHRWQSKNQEKSRAHEIVRCAVRRGELVRPQNCVRCSKPCHPDAHHHDYAKPLDVIWLCRKCHVQADRERDTHQAAPHA